MAPECVGDTKGRKRIVKLEERIHTDTGRYPEESTIAPKDRAGGGK